MRVIEYKHIKPKYAFCRGCGAILEFTAAESSTSKLALQKGLQNKGEDYFVRCPACSRVISDGEWKDSVDEC